MSSLPGKSTSGSRYNPFDDALNKFKAELNNKEKQYFEISSADEFCHKLDAFQTKLHNGRRQQNLTKLRGFIEAMSQFGKVIDVFCQTSEVLAFIWGPWKLLLLIGDTYATAFSELLDTYKELGKTLKSVLQARDLFPNDPEMAETLVGIYLDVLEFHKRALKYLQQPMMQQIFKATWKTYKTKFSDLLSAMSHHRELLLGSITLADMRQRRQATEAQQLKENSEFHFRVRKEVIGWLQSPNMKNEHQKLFQIRSEYPETGRWLFAKRQFKTWFNEFPSIPALLWLNGIPGAGKTVLASLVIDKAKLLDHKPSVLFFYVTYTKVVV
ncbi:vegetative incompatibility protein HET-E-1 [Colletotrichum asianum]|uniref:Vegetative incompatibility protein HET-E-1 n=1 Tax=Colletotrichum asianum TaxID=702518 RepID=A0A8H3WHL5_9PEZI|nr:vegetative incompatibility protein HET-E-1 [Colletotrichum asianum]